VIPCIPMKTWEEVRKLTRMAEAKGWSLENFKAVLDWEWSEKPVKGSLRAPGAKRTMSAEARKKISDAQKKRWAKKATKS